MAKKQFPQSVYEPIQNKTFKATLKNFLIEEFPQIGGPMIIDLLVDKIESMIDEFYPPTQHLKMGQMLWFSVAKDEKPAYGKTMDKTRIVPTILSLVTDDEIEKIKQGTPRKEIKDVRRSRLLREADQQQGVLSYSDLSLIGLESLRWISSRVISYEKEHQCILPRRGTIHDMGRSFSHKPIICKKRKLEQKSTSEVARETNHSPEAVDRYTLNLDRVSFCLKKGLSVNETSFVTSIGKNTVIEYQALDEEINSDKYSDLFNLDNLPF